MYSPPKPQPRSELEKATHPHWRRYTAKYRRKRRIVRDLWLGSGLLMLGVPVGAVPAIALGTTMVAFMILDETP